MYDFDHCLLLQPLMQIAGDLSQSVYMPLRCILLGEGAANHHLLARKRECNIDLCSTLYMSAINKGVGSTM